MPKWLKILLGVLAVGIIACVGLGIWGVMTFQDYGKKMMDPTQTQKVVASFADIPTLPPGFEYALNFDLSMLKIKFGTIKHGDDDMIILGTIPMEGSESQESIQAKLEKNSDSVSGTSEFKEDGKGTETVGGEAFNYKTGTAVDKKSGKPVATMYGVLCPKSMPQTAVFIFGVQTSGNKYDMTNTKQVLSSIQGFHP